MKYVFVMLFSFLFLLSHAQSLPDFDKIKLEADPDYKAADSAAHLAASYLLSTPFKKDEASRSSSLEFLLKWAKGTPDFSFSLANVATKVTNGNEDMLGLYIACMSKFCLENKDLANKTKVVRLNAVRSIIAYCKEPANNMPMNEPLKTLSAADQKGELQKSLDM